MAHGALARRWPLPGGRRLSGHPSTEEGHRALRLVVGGLALVPLGALLVRVVELPSAVGVLGLLGLLAIVAGGVLAVLAIARRGERSIFVFATLPVWFFAVFVVLGEVVAICIAALA